MYTNITLLSAGPPTDLTAYLSKRDDPVPTARYVVHDSETVGFHSNLNIIHMLCKKIFQLLYESNISSPRTLTFETFPIHRSSFAYDRIT